MLIPVVHVRQNGGVSTEGSEGKLIEASDPLFTRLGLAGPLWLQLEDGAAASDTARGAVSTLLASARGCWVGALPTSGGAASVDAAVKWLDGGARKVVRGDPPGWHPARRSPTLGTACTTPRIRPPQRARACATRPCPHPLFPPPGL